MGVLGIRIWEWSVLGSVIFSFLYWLKFSRTKFTLGIYLGFTLCFGWTWLYDMPFLLRLSNPPESFGGFTFGGHWEPLWTAFSYCALALPIMLCLGYRDWLQKKMGVWRHPIIAFTTGILIMFYEGGYGVLLLNVETYHWRPEFIIGGVPWPNTFIFVPLLIALPILFAESFGKLIAAAGDIAFTDPKTARSLPLGIGSWSSFWMGFAIPQVAMYINFIVLLTLLDHLQPWTPLPVVHL